MISAQTQRLKYVAGDFLSSNIALFLYNCARYYFGSNRTVFHPFANLEQFLTSHNVILGQLLFPISMMIVYYLSGYYTEVFRKSRLQELVTTLASAFISALIVFFIAIIDFFQKKFKNLLQFHFKCYILYANNPQCGAKGVVIDDCL